jgi:hypothetical protein
MKTIAFMILLLSGSAFAQQPPTNSPLLDHLAGHWVLRGTLAGKQTTHDVDADWILDHHYLRIRETSREKNSSGKPQYEALVIIGWNPKPQTYVAIWLDVYGGMGTESMGVAQKQESSLPFVFKDKKGEIDFTNDFIYNQKTDSWEWELDNVVNGEHKPFGRVKLTRK